MDDSRLKKFMEKKILPDMDKLHDSAVSTLLMQGCTQREAEHVVAGMFTGKAVDTIGMMSVRSIATTVGRKTGRF